MYYLIVVFLAPAVLILFLGIISCLKKTSSKYDDKDYQSINSNDDNTRVNVIPYIHQNSTSSYQMIYENPHFVEYKKPPTYREAIRQQNVLQLQNTNYQIAHSTRHLPPNQPRILDNSATFPNKYSIY